MDYSGFSDRDLLIQLLSVTQTIEEELVEIRHQIHGNGQPGLKDRVAKLEEIAGLHRKFMFATVGIILASIPSTEIITKILEKMAN